MAGATSAAAILLHASLNIHFGGDGPSQLMTTQGTLLVSRYKYNQLSSPRRQNSVIGPFRVCGNMLIQHIDCVLHSSCTALLTLTLHTLHTAFKKICLNNLNFSETFALQPTPATATKGCRSFWRAWCANDVLLQVALRESFKRFRMRDHRLSDEN